MKKIIIILIIFSLIFTSFLILKKEEKANKNISVILETEEGNIKSNTFPNKNDYEYLNTECENTSDFINTIFNENTWKLNLSVEEKSIDGNFNCTVYFKEKIKKATEVIKTKDEVEKIIHTPDNSLQNIFNEETIEYRYRGKEVDNYVKFNDELYRIIGKFKVEDGYGKETEMIKIIKSEPYRSYKYDEKNYHNWARPSTLNTILNITFYNSLKEDCRKLIGEVKYYLGGYKTTEINTKNM